MIRSLRPEPRSRLLIKTVFRSPLTGLSFHLLELGDHFGMDGYLRFSFGLPEGYLREGLDRISQLITTLS